MRYENKALRDLANGAPCMLQIVGVCSGDTETVVWCHSNEGRHGKGKGIKAHDIFGVPGCAACHYWYDFIQAPRARKEIMFRGAMDRTWLWLWQTGKVGVVTGKLSAAKEPKPSPAKPRRADSPTARPSKILPRI